MQNTLTQLAQQVGQRLKDLSMKMVTAESCTGGGVAYYLTMIPGSSAWLERGLVTYSNAAKLALLQVNPTTLNTHGAVSTETATEMALGALNNSPAQVSIAVTGIAGPTGGSITKPVGMVCFSFATHHKQCAETQYFSGNRLEIREQAIRFALEKLLDFLV